MDTMPDPLHLRPDDPGDIPAEIPIREVLGHVAVAIGGPFTEYALSHAYDDLERPAASVLRKAIGRATEALDDLVDTWDAVHPTGLSAKGPMRLVSPNGLAAEVKSVQLTPAPVPDCHDNLGLGVRVTHVAYGTEGTIDEYASAGPGSDAGERFRVRWDRAQICWHTPEELRPV